MTTFTPSTRRTQRSLTHAAIYLGIGIILFLGLSSPELVDRLDAVSDKLSLAIFLLMLTAFGLTTITLGRWIWRLINPQPDLSPAFVIELNLDQPSRFVERLFTDTEQPPDERT